MLYIHQNLLDLGMNLADCTVHPAPPSRVSHGRAAHYICRAGALHGRLPAAQGRGRRLPRRGSAPSRPGEVEQLAAEFTG